MNPYVKVNLDHWNELVPLHRDSAFYDLPAFRAGKLSLHPLEVREVAEAGGVAGKSLLHLQCHFGMDTLSWARLGAKVTGIDFSPAAIDLAQTLAAEIGFTPEQARFVESAVEDVPERLGEQFDWVFTSYGALCWLPDLERWAETVARSLKPDGTFYMAEIHPAGMMFDEASANPPSVGYPYLRGAEPDHYVNDSSYASGNQPREHRGTYEWAFPLGDVVTALSKSGLRIQYLREWPFCCYRMLNAMEQAEDGFWWLPGYDRLPFLFSLLATH